MATNHYSQDHDKDFAATVRSTLLVGGGSGITMVIGIVRTKFVASLIGPSGVALFTLFNQLAEMVGAVTSFGLGTSGVRQIAVAHASEHREKLARTVKTLRRTTWCTGILGLVLMVVGARLAALATFGDAAKALPIALMGVMVLLRSLTTGRTCIVQGTRRIKDLVLLNVAGAIGALAASVPCVYVWGMEGIVPGLVLGSAASLAVAWWFSRRIPMARLDHSWDHTRSEARELLRFGFPIMLMGLVGTVTPYLERVILLRTIGLESLGFYQAAYALTGALTTFVIGAMTADCYPKLVGHAEDPERLAKELNTQIEASLLMAMPGVLWLFALASLAVIALYSPEFTPAVAVLRITLLGVIGRLLGWPLRLAFMAKGMGRTVLLFELGSGAVGLGMITWVTPILGAPGAGWAFTLVNLLLPIAQLGILRRVAGVGVSPANLARAGWGLLALGALAANETFTSVAGVRWVIALFITVTGTFVCARTLSQRTGWGFRRLLDRVRVSLSSGPSPL